MSWGQYVKQFCHFNLNSTLCDYNGSPAPMIWYLCSYEKCYKSMIKTALKALFDWQDLYINLKKHFCQIFNTEWAKANTAMLLFYPQTVHQNRCSQKLTVSRHISIVQHRVTFTVMRGYYPYYPLLAIPISLLWDMGVQFEICS